MAQDTTTVTPPNPTPPTNFSCTGATPPNPPNFTKATYTDPVGTPPPYFDDGSAGSVVAIAAKTAALASGTGATSGGTENSYPGEGSPAYEDGPNDIGAVPASTSVDGEGRGTEDVETAAVGNPSPDGQLRTVSVLGNYTGIGGMDSNGNTSPSPNQQHASSLSPTTTTLTSISPTTTASGVGTQALTCTGVGFTSQSVIYVNGVAQTTTFVSSTSLTATVTKKTSAGTWPVVVKTAGLVQTAAQTWTFT